MSLFSYFTVEYIIPVYYNINMSHFLSRMFSPLLCKSRNLGESNSKTMQTIQMTATMHATVTGGEG